MNYKIRFILSAVFAIGAMEAGAQTDEAVNVAYRSVDAQDLLGSVSTIDIKALTNKNYNTYSLNNLQGYVGGWNGASMWGMDDYLVLVDGIPRSAGTITPTEIDQVTFMKGAAAVVLYGSQGSKGVVLITTKRGRNTGLNVDIRANTGWQVAKSWPEYMGSAEYMLYFNEARVNDGMTPLYSQTDLWNYSSGVNPYRYPNVDMYSEKYLKKAYNVSDVTAEIEGGGGGPAQYYVHLGYTNARDYFQFGQAKNNSSSSLSVRGNVDMKISKRIKAFANTSAIFSDSNTNHGNYWSAAATLRPNRITPLIPVSMIDPNAAVVWDVVGNANNFDGNNILGGTQADPTNIFGQMYAAGSARTTSRWFMFDTGVDIDLGGWIEGLSFRTKFAVDYATGYTASFDNDYATYEPQWASHNGQDVIVGMTMHNLDRRDGRQNISNSADIQTTLLSAQFDYKRTFGERHNLSGMLMMAGWQQAESSVYHKPSNANMGLQLNYNFDHRYYVEASAALVHSAKLAEGHRQKISPSLTLGWRAVRNRGAIDDMVLSVSGSILNQDVDIEDYYLYASSWNRDYGWEWFTAQNLQYTFSERGANENLTYVQRRELSANLRTSLWKGLVTADASVFVNNMSGGVVERIDLYPNYLNIGYPNASYVPYSNYEKQRRTGFDFAVNLNRRLGEVDFSLGVAGTWYNSKWIVRNELNNYDYQNRKGRAVDGLWGLQSKGLFKNQAAIDAAPAQMFGGTVRPGDIQYVDQNGDNVINDLDQVYLGKSGWYGDPFTLGINLTAKWRNVTLFALATGGFGAHAMKSSSYYWVDGSDKYSAAVRDRWTVATAETATYPRLSAETSNNNYRNSDFWMYKTDRLNLAKVQVTYDLPEAAFGKSFVKGLSVYVSGSNLLTISKERKHMEMAVGQEPFARFFNIGAKVKF